MRRIGYSIVLALSIGSLQLLYCQNYFPLDSIKSICIQIYHDDWESGKRDYVDYKNIYTIPDTLIHGQKFYNYYFDKYYFLRYEENIQKLFIYLPQYDSTFVAIDFNLQIPGDTATMYIFGYQELMKTNGLDSLFLWGMVRKQNTFRGYYAYIPYYTFTEGLGFTEHFDGNPGPGIGWTDETTLYAAVIGDSNYNELIITFDSTSVYNDRELDTFPFVLEVFGSLSNSNFIDSFYTEVKVIRDGISIFEEKYPVHKYFFYSFINIDSTILDAGDTIKYRVVYKDHSIFLKYLTYPDTGYISFKVLPVITSIKSEKHQVTDFMLYEIYPNPFNSTAKISFYLPHNMRVLIKVYDILGYEIKTLIDDNLVNGFHSIDLIGDELSSGVYILRFQTPALLLSKKIILLK